MTRDDIIKLAIEAGFDAMETHLRTTYVSTPSDIERFANLVAAAAKAEEREACARVCDENTMMIGLLCAATIRARGNA